MILYKKLSLLILFSLVYENSINFYFVYNKNYNVIILM